MQAGQRRRESGFGSEWDSVADQGDRGVKECTAGRYHLFENTTGRCFQSIVESSWYTAAGSGGEFGSSNQCAGDAEHGTDFRYDQG